MRCWMRRWRRPQLPRSTHARTRRRSGSSASCSQVRCVLEWVACGAGWLAGWLAGWTGRAQWESALPMRSGLAYAATVATPQPLSPPAACPTLFSPVAAPPTDGTVRQVPRSSAALRLLLAEGSVQPSAANVEAVLDTAGADSCRSEIKGLLDSIRAAMDGPWLQLKKRRAALVEELEEAQQAGTADADFMRHFAVAAARVAVDAAAALPESKRAACKRFWQLYSLADARKAQSERWCRRYSCELAAHITAFRICFGCLCLRLFVPRLVACSHSACRPCLRSGCPVPHRV